MVVKNSKISIISVVWFIPIVAILTGIWLLYSYYKSLGTLITLYISDAEGLEVNNTVLKVLNVEVGKIKNIKLSDNGNSVVMKAYVNSDNVKLLSEDAQYWVVRPRIGKAGISGLSTLVSGSYIEVMPGKSDNKKTEFIVYDRPPLRSYKNQGTIVKLIGKNNNTLLSPGSAVLYHGVQVGTVEYAYFNPTNKTTNYQIFISSPNDELLGTNVNFWINMGISVGAQGGEIKIQGLNLDNLVGSIAFSEPAGENKGDKITEDTEFILYSDKSEVPSIIPNNAFYLVGFFDQNIRNLAENAVVEYKGIRIGKVAKVPYFSSVDRQKILINKAIPVLFYIDPQLIGADKKEAIELQIKQAIKNGLVATMASDSLLTGGKYIYLYEKTISDVLVYPVKKYQNYIVVPTTTSGFDNLLENINQLLKQLQDLPLDKTMTKFNKNLDELKSILNSISHITEDLDKNGFGTHLNEVINQLKKTLKSISPDSKIYKDLDRLIQNLNQLILKLNSKPNSLLFNYSKTDPVPKAR